MKALATGNFSTQLNSVSSDFAGSVQSDDGDVHRGVNDPTVRVFDDGDR